MPPKPTNLSMLDDDSDDDDELDFMTNFTPNRAILEGTPTHANSSFSRAAPTTVIAATAEVDKHSIEDINYAAAADDDDDDDDGDFGFQDEDFGDLAEEAFAAADAAAASTSNNLGHRDNILSEEWSSMPKADLIEYADRLSNLANTLAVRIADFLEDDNRPRTAIDMLVSER